MAPESASAAVKPGQRLTVRPEQHTDVVYSIVLDTKAVLKTILVLVGPPGIATAVWYAQQRRDPGPHFEAD